MIKTNTTKKTCVQCGELFIKKSVESLKYWETKTCCSTSCAGLLKSKCNVRNKTCVICSKVFNIVKKPIKERVNIKFCSRKCFFVSRKGMKFNDEWRKNMSISLTRTPRIERNCKQCKKIFQVPKYTLDRKDKNQGIFCCRLCLNRYLGNKNKGENNPNWKGGLLPIHTYIRNSTEYKIWRMEIFKRDNFTCLECKTKGVILNADHIKPFSIILKQNKITNFEEALSCKELWDTDNGRTLCKDCHLKIGWNRYRSSTFSHYLV